MSSLKGFFVQSNIGMLRKFLNMVKTSEAYSLIKFQKQTCSFSGPTHFKLWSRKDGAKKDFVVEGLHGDQGENVTFSDHIWLVDNNIAVATLDDVIFIVREGTVQLVCAVMPK